MVSHPEEQRDNFRHLSQMAGSWVFCFAIARGLSEAGAGYGTFGFLIAGCMGLFCFWTHKASWWDRRHIELQELDRKRRLDELERKQRAEEAPRQEPRR